MLVGFKKSLRRKIPSFVSLVLTFVPKDDHIRPRIGYSKKSLIDEFSLIII